MNNEEDKDILSKQDYDNKKVELSENLEIELEGDGYQSINIVSLKN